jgi:type I restriction enzyme S subunit
MSNLVPEGWVQTRIGKVSKLQGGYAFKSTDSAESGIRWLKIANVGIGRVKWADKSFLPKSFESQYADFILNDGDSVVALTRPIIGGELKVAQIGGSDTPALLNQRVARINPNPKLINRDFLYSLFRYEQISKEIVITVYGTDPPNVSTKQIEDIKFHLPPLPEQQKIAAILSSVDEVIEKTQAQINKLKDLKTGMMQELLSPREGQAANIHITQGESKNGLHHTELKDSPLGRIPVGWDRVSLQSLSALITKGATPTTQGHAYTDNTGVLFYRSVNASEDGTLKLKNIKYISEEANSTIKRSKLQLGDVTLSIVGAKTGRTYFCVTNESELPANINQNIALIRPIPDSLDYRFLRYVITSSYFQYQVDMEITTQAQPCLSLKQVGDFLINLPPINLQIDISNKLDSASSMISAKEKKLHQIALIKKALMQDLLTGKVRVKVNAA